MTPEARRQSLKAFRLTLKNITGKELARRLRVDEATAGAMALRGMLIDRAESLKLTQPEFDALKVIARMEARHVSLPGGKPTLAQVDRAAGKRSGWCKSIISRRLTLMPGLTFAACSDRGHVWLTEAGWCLAWESKLIKSNWKVPA